MMIKKLLGTILLCAGLVVQSLPVQAAVLEPRECPKDLKYLLGIYYGNGEQFVIRERNGELELLYRTTREDYKFANSNQFPLKKERFDSYTLLEAGPMNNTETSVRFERDPDGYGITCKRGCKRQKLSPRRAGQPRKRKNRYWRSIQVSAVSRMYWTWVRTSRLTKRLPGS